MTRCRIDCSLLVAAALLCAACSRGPGPATPETAPTTAAPVVEAPVLEVGPGGAAFFAYGEGGDEATAAIAGARIAIIDDPDAWWKALRDDAPDGMEALPPGYQVRSTAERIAAAPAKWITTGADGTALGEERKGRVYCAVAPGVDDLIAGCSEWQHFRGVPISIYFSNGRALFMSAADDALDGSSHYSNLMWRRSASLDPVRVAYVGITHMDFSDEQYPEGWYFANVGRVAVIEDAEIGQWWRVISQDDELAPSAWSGSQLGDEPQMGPFVRLRFPSEALDSAPAQYLDLSGDRVPEVTLAAGDYLLCDLSRPDRRGDVGIFGCIYEDITGPHDTVIEIQSDGDAFYDFREKTSTAGAALLAQRRCPACQESPQTTICEACRTIPITSGPVSN